MTHRHAVLTPAMVDILVALQGMPGEHPAERIAKHAGMDVRRIGKPLAGLHGRGLIVEGKPQYAWAPPHQRKRTWRVSDSMTDVEWGRVLLQYCYQHGVHASTLLTSEEMHRYGVLA